MITEIKTLRSIGKFYNYSAKGDRLDWHKNTFIFAPNAYGKSTLVDVLRSMQANDPNVIRGRRTLDAPTTAPYAVIIIDSVPHVFNGSKWEKTYREIQFFDLPFIHANILSPEIEYEHRKNIHKIIIGAQGITLAEELAELKAEDKDKHNHVKSIDKQFKTVGFPHHTVEAFLAIPATEEAAVAARIQKLEQEIKSKESETHVRTLSFPSAMSAPAFDLAPAKELAGQKLIVAHEAARTRVLAHIDQNFKQRGQAQAFIRQGLELVQGDCPFCGQDLNGAADLLRAYQEFFDDAFSSYQTNLKEKFKALADWNLDNKLTEVVASYNANAAILKQWEPFIDAETFPDAAAFVEAARTKLTGLKANVQTELQKKQNDPDAEADLLKFEALAAELTSLREYTDLYNAAVTAFRDLAKDYVANLPTSGVDAIRRALAKEREIEKRFESDWKKWAANYPAAENDAREVRAKKEAKQKELEEYSKTIFETYQKRINELLLTFGADFGITDLIGKTDERANESYTDFGFIILEKKVPRTTPQDDGPCFKNTLSEGDKATLAFAFFLASLEKTPDLDKQILILDDPLSSLDQTRREATARVLLELSPKLRQLCVFTHKKDFLQMLFDKIPDKTVFQLLSDKKNGSRLVAFDVEEDRKGEYRQMVDDLVRYADEDFGPTPETIQGNIRKVIEIVLKTKYYCVLAEDIRLNKGLAKLLKTAFATGRLNSDLETELFDLCSVTNGPHHGDIVDVPSKKLTRDELIPLITQTFILLEKM